MEPSPYFRKETKTNLLDWNEMEWNASEASLIILCMSGKTIKWTFDNYQWPITIWLILLDGLRMELRVASIFGF